MPYTVELSPKGKRAFYKLPIHIKNTILQHLRSLAVNPRPEGVKKLKAMNAWRMRIGDYRVIYEIHDDVLLVLVIHVAHRREAYRK
ncbi:MAG: type II toxin-antitoxin system RelE/ParE family toxin [Desulfovibrio sp.]|jgi:mRNA interferase RelE/StbE|nr:type II toxin-antitoxin system RelE/ParE family toxin [Desulfovibrio sp.]